MNFNSIINNTSPTTIFRGCYHPTHVSESLQSLRCDGSQWPPHSDVAIGSVAEEIRFCDLGETERKQLCNWLPELTAFLSCNGVG